MLKGWCTAEILTKEVERRSDEEPSLKTLALLSVMTISAVHQPFKVPISWLGILHIYNIWNPVIRIAIYLVVRKCYLRGHFGC